MPPRGDRRVREARGVPAVDHEDGRLLGRALALDRRHRDAQGVHAEGGLQALLEVVRIEVLTVHDHQVLHAPCDVQLPAAEEAEVPGVQPALPLQGGVGGGGVVEVPLGHVVAADPDPAHVILGEPAAVEPGDPDLDAVQGAAAAHGDHGAVPVRLPHGVARPRGLAGEPDPVDDVPEGREGHRQRGLGEPVDREDGGPREAGRGEAVEELPGERQGDGLGPVHDEPHPGEVEAVGDPLAVDGLQGVPVPEVRRGEDRRPEGGRVLQPDQRRAREGRRGHEHLVRAAEQRREVEAHEAHVVGERHPAERAVPRPQPDAVTDGPQVGQGLAVPDDHALRGAGGAGAELHERHLVGAALHLGARRPLPRGPAAAGRHPGLAEALEARVLDHEGGPGAAGEDVEDLRAAGLVRGRRERHRHEAAELAGPEDLHEGRGVVHRHDDLAAALDAGALEVPQPPQRSLPELGHGRPPVLAGLLEEAEPLLPAPLGAEEIDEGLGVGHRAFAIGA